MGWLETQDASEFVGNSVGTINVSNLWCHSNKDIEIKLQVVFLILPKKQRILVLNSKWRYFEKQVGGVLGHMQELWKVNGWKDTWLIVLFFCYKKLVKLVKCINVCVCLLAQKNFITRATNMALRSEMHFWGENWNKENKWLLCTLQLLYYNIQNKIDSPFKLAQGDPIMA